MTSEKSLTDAAARFDLRRCFKTNFLLPLLPFLLLCGTNIMAVIDYNSQNTDTVFRYVLFDAEGLFSRGVYIIQIFLVIIGIFTAVKAFAFLTSVRQTNVYFSAGLSRMQLLKNRLLSCLVCLFAAVFLPMLLAVALNAVFFSITPALLAAAFYYGFAFFADLLFGFALGCVFMLLVGNVLEGVCYSLMAGAVPTVFFGGLQWLLTGYVNGAAYGASYSASTFSGMCVGLISKYKNWNPVYFLDGKTSAFWQTEAQNHTEISAQDLLPVVGWLIAGCVLLSITPSLLKKRRAENAGMFGAHKGAAVFAGSCAAFAAFSFTAFVLFGRSQILSAVLSVVFACLLYIIVIALIYRSKADIAKAARAVPAVAAVCGLCLLCCFTGFFGLYNKVPDAADIEYAYAAGSISDPMNEITHMTSAEQGITDADGIYGKFTDEADLKILTSVQEKVVDSLGDGTDTYCLVYQMKDGRRINRFYYHVSAEATEAALQIFDTVWYKEQLKFALSGRDFLAEENALFDQDIDWNDRIALEEQQIESDRLSRYAAYNGDIVLLNASATEGLTLDLTESKKQQLRNCLRADLTAMTAAERFMPSQRAVYLLRFGTFDVEDYTLQSPTDVCYGIHVPVYASMQKTLAFLHSAGLDVPSTDASQVQCVRLMPLKDAFSSSLSDFGDRNMDSRRNQLIALSAFSKHYLTAYNDSSVTAFAAYKAITDPEQIAALFSGWHSQYAAIGDEGRLAQFTLKDGSVFTAYIPEKNLPDFVK